MTHCPVRPRLLALAAAAVLAASPANLIASGFQLVEQNGSGLGNAYAGQAAGVKDASAIYYNPAALTRIEGKQFLVSVSGIGVSTTFLDASSGRPFLPTSPPLVLPVPLGGNGGNAGDWIPVPNAYFSWKAASQWWVGLGLNAPFGLKTEWDDPWEGRFHASKSQVTTININPTLAFKVNDVLSLGAGANYQRLHAELSQSVAYGGASVGAAQVVGGPLAAAGILAQLGGPAGLAREGVSTVKGDDWKWGWNVGATLKLGDNGWLGASYRSAVNHNVEGDATFVNAPAFATAGPLGALGAGLNARFADGPVTAEVKLPQTVSVAASYEGRNFELLADWTWTGWSSIQALSVKRADGSTLSSVPLNFQDTWRVGLGSNIRLNDSARLRLGVAWDKAPVQDLFRTPRLPDEDRTWVAGGLQYKVSKNSLIDLGYAHLFVKDASSNLPNQDSATSPPSGNLVGSYEEHVNIVSLQYRISF